MRIRFLVAVWVFARHLHIYGTVPNGAGGAPSSEVLQNPPTYHSALSPSDARAHGIHNMLLVYTGDHGSLGLWSQLDFLPMLGYTSLTGSAPSARMFDTMLFLPYGSVADTQSGWQAYLNDLFASNQQLSSLDAAVGQVNQELSTPGYKEKVVLTLPYASYGDGVWGSVNGNPINLNGTSDDPLALQARHQAMQWYLQTLLSMWNNAHFQNLELTGLYWENEAVNEERPGEVPLIQDAVSLAHQNNLPLFWIPYYDAAGIADWQTLDFDAAWLQPNYVEQGTTADIGRIRNAEQYATAHGMGLELEVTSTDSQVQTLYSQSIDQLVADGFAGNVSHAWYAGSKLLVTAANSSDPNTRLLYDNTYNMIAHP
ncbi:DUF4855 domain-containing protein [Alicyclobacillus pomorum]|uniref:DUF4855 domain-containing protein n=1 Tax=Alicyclobacillus pomorum TaxID=204470 RepID=UPI0006845E99|nr:DUF4855 domain-containing protein [Alicyclobacillus pomorum]